MSGVGVVLGTRIRRGCGSRDENQCMALAGRGNTDAVN